MLKRLISGFYSRMLLFFIAMICTVTMALFFLSNSLIEKQRRLEYLQNYEIELNNLSSILAAKENSLANTLVPVFSSPSRYQTLCSLYKDRTLSVSSVSYSIIQMLQEICQHDQYCRGILLRTGNLRLFLYDPVYDTLVSIPLNLQTGFSFTPYELQTLSDAQLRSLSPDYSLSSDPLFGLSSTLFDYRGSDMLPVGQFIILYSVSEFTGSVAAARLDGEALFSITDKDRNVLYASDGRYDSSRHLILSSPDEGNTGNQTLDGKNYAWGSVWNPEYEYLVSYQIPTSRIGDNSHRLILAALAFFICLASILLYIFTLRHVNLKVKSILTGMSLAGRHNLDYRMPVPKSQDEFTEIITGFNRMCDEIQKNAEMADHFENAEKKAELYAMQTSINPHFLYNTLEQIRGLVMQMRYEDASQMILLLSRMYRNQTRRNLYVSIGEELELCENLINLYMYRYGNFDYEFSVPNSARIYGIPKSTLYPLIENYFTHGLDPSREDNLLTVTVRSRTEKGKEWLEFSVEDNGLSISPEDLTSLEEKLTRPVMEQKEENGFALSNVNTRLTLVFGPASRLYPSPGKDGKGFCIRFSIPPILPGDLTRAKP